MTLIDRTVRELLDDFSSAAPTPGGGSAAALASAVGASLLLMVARMPKSRAATDEGQAALASAAGALDTIRARLVEAVDADAAAYDGVVAAFKMPKGLPDEQHARTAAIQRAMQGAADVPLQVMQWSSDALQHAIAIATHGNRSASSDVGTAVGLLRAGLRGAQLNVEINLGSIRDETYAAGVRADRDRFVSAAASAADAAEALLRGRDA